MDIVVPSLWPDRVRLVRIGDKPVVFARTDGAPLAQLHGLSASGPKHVTIVTCFGPVIVQPTQIVMVAIVRSAVSVSSRPLWASDLDGAIDSLGFDPGAAFAELAVQFAAQGPILLHRQIVIGVNAAVHSIG
jgi:hypothetical protein